MKEIDSLKKAHAEELDAYKARIRELEMASCTGTETHSLTVEINSLKKAHADELNTYETRESLTGKGKKN